MTQATVAIEDRRFYEHGGVDYAGIVRAALKNITAGKSLQGGSTLTMQLVRNLYTPDTRYQKTLTRKIREAKLADELEQEHTKAGSSTRTSTTSVRDGRRADRRSASRRRRASSSTSPRRG